MYTRHGHRIPGTVATERPETISQCGGITGDRICNDCAIDAARALPKALAALQLRVAQLESRLLGVIELERQRAADVDLVAKYELRRTAAILEGENDPAELYNEPQRQARDKAVAWFKRPEGENDG